MDDSSSACKTKSIRCHRGGIGFQTSLMFSNTISCLWLLGTTSKHQKISFTFMMAHWFVDFYGVSRRKTASQQGDLTTCRRVSVLFQMLPEVFSAADQSSTDAIVKEQRKREVLVLQDERWLNRCRVFWTLRHRAVSPCTCSTCEHVPT